MDTTIKTHKLGKLRIYLKTGESIKSKSLLRKLFPKNTYQKIVEEARKSGIRDAHVFHTHTSFTNSEKIQQKTLEGDNSGLTVCIELVDERKKLEQFFKTHRAILKGKTIIFKEVEFWDIEE